MAAILTKIYLALFFSIPFFVVLAGLFCVRRAYSTYKLLGEHSKTDSFLLFFTALQSPWYASQFWGQADIAEALPVGLKARFIKSRQQINLSLVALFLWVAFVLLVGAMAAYLRRHS